jgi:ribosomal protein L37E
MPMLIEVCNHCGSNSFIWRRQVQQCEDCGCGDRKEITVYTQAELDEAVKAAYRTAQQIVEDYDDKPNMYRGLNIKIKELENG